MARSNLAYDLSRFEDQTAEQREKPQIKKVEQAKTFSRPASHISPLKAVGCMLIVLIVVSSLMLLRVQLNETITEVSKANEQLTELKAQGTKMSLQLESKVSLKNAEDYATSVLGMVKTDSNNVQYVKLTQQNKIEVLKAPSTDLWTTITNFFKNLLS